MWKTILIFFIFLIKSNYLKNVFKLKYQHIYNKEQKYLKHYVII